MIPCLALRFTIGAIVALPLLSYIIRRGARGKAPLAGATLSACRGWCWYTFGVGRHDALEHGHRRQEISKTGMGLLSYQRHYFGREGLLIAALVRLAPLGAWFGLTRFFPPWEAGAA